MAPGDVIYPAAGVVLWDRDPELVPGDAKIIGLVGTGIVIATGFKHPWTLVLTVDGALGWTWTTSVAQSVVIP